MTKQPSYAVEFCLVDPTELNRTSSLEAATVVRMMGQVQGNREDLGPLNVVQGSRLVNHNLSRLEESKRGRKTILDTVTDSGYYNFYYCSRCGRKFQPQQCQRCNISFTTSSMESVIGGFPGIPAKVVAYARQLGHAFMHEPPRA